MGVRNQYNEIIENFIKNYAADANGEAAQSPFGITLGVVVDTDDPLQSHRLRVFCPALNDNPKKIHHLPWCVQASPFGGSIKNDSYARGHGVGPAESSGAVHYGFSAVPEQGAHVLVTCIDGNPQRRVWLACIPEHQETHTLHHGRWKWDGGGGTPDGPLTSDGSPIEPAYTNMGKAFDGDRTSREWKTRAAEYQESAVRKDVGEIPNKDKSQYLDEQYDDIAAAEQDAWVKPILGAHGYDWTGNKALGAFLSSRVYGFSTPGFHALTLDDRPFNSRARLRTAAGHQILMDDTNERIYISTYEGNNYIEMDGNGNIDIYSKRRVSIHSEKDINMFSDETIRIGGKKGIHMYAGYDEGQESLDEIPADGQIRMHAEDDIHVITKKNYRHLSFEDTLIEVGGKKCETIGEDLFLQVQGEINIVTNTGDFNLTVSGSLNELVQGDTNKYALGTMKNMSNGNAQMHSFGGKLDVGAQASINMKSIAEDISLEAVGKNPTNAAGVFVKTPESQFGVSSEGVMTATNKKIKSKSFEPIEYEQGIETDQDYPHPEPMEDLGDCNIGDMDTEGYTGAALAARLAYNAGFRGQALVTITAIAGAESAFSPNAVGDVHLQSNKWGPSVGMWQIRTLNDPNAWSGVDALRNVNILLGDDNAQINADVAYMLSKNGTKFSDWSVFTSGAYKSFLAQANAAVASMCSGMMALVPDDGLLQSFNFADTLGQSMINSCMTSLMTGRDANAFIMNELGVQIQTTKDLLMKSVEEEFDTKFFNDVCKTLNDLTRNHDLLTLTTGLSFSLQASMMGTPAGVIAGALLFLAQIDIDQIMAFLEGEVPLVPNLSALGQVNWLNIIGINLDIETICSLEVPFFEDDIKRVFDMDFNHEAFGGTII